MSDGVCGSRLRASDFYNAECSRLSIVARTGDDIPSTRVCGSLRVWNDDEIAPHSATDAAGPTIIASTKAPSGRMIIRLRALDLIQRDVEACPRLDTH